jgi:hypothetical protein
MPFGENGCQIDEDARKRLNDLFHGIRPEKDALAGKRIDDLRRQLEAERQKVGDLDEVTRADILRRAYAEKHV